LAIQNIKLPTEAPLLSVWFVHDQRPGHIKQLKGLAERLSAHCKLEASWIDANLNTFSWTDALLKKKPDNQLPPPNIVIAAGHKTHKTLLIIAHIYQAFSVVLMKPSLPICLFDTLICPKHDELKESHKVLNTLGALNNINPVGKTQHRTKKLMLIGGPSKHFKWQEQLLLGQIQSICHQQPNKQWLLSDSPRTPASFMPRLKALNISNLNCFHYKDKQLEDLSTLLKKCTETWISPDSVSMIYESLTAGSPSFLFDLKPSSPKKPSRVARAINNLVQEQLVGHFLSWQKTPDKQPQTINLWEADRAAQWLLIQYSLKQPI